MHNSEIENINPWKTLSVSTVYDNPWIQVTEAQVINPSGGNGIYGKVHFKNYAIGIVALTADKRIWLVGQYRYPLSRYSWEIPEGGGALGVDPLISAQRELMEEVGLKAEKWEKFFEMHLSNSVSDEWGIVFLATELSQFQSNPEETEQLSTKLVSIPEAFDLVERGVITDSMSVAAIYKLALTLKD